MDASRLCRLLVCSLVAALAVPATRAAAPPQPRLDLYGDPLPAGAIARLGTLRFWHDSFVQAMAYSPDGKWLATDDEDSLSIWEANTGKLLLRFGGIGQDGDPRQLVFSRDGKRLAVASRYAARVWDLAAAKELHRLDVRRLPAVETVAFSPDGKTLATGGKDSGVRIWDLATGERVGELGKADDWVVSVAYSPNGKSLVALSGDEEHVTDCRIWDVRTGKQTSAWKPKNAFRPVAALSPRADVAVLRGADYHLHLGSADAGKRLQHLRVAPRDGETAYCWRVAFSADGKRLAAGDTHGHVVVWDVATGKELLRPEKLPERMTCLALSPDGKTLAVGAWRSVRFLDVKTGNQRDRLPLYPSGVGRVAFTRDDNAVSYSRDQVRTWDASSGRLLSMADGSRKTFDVRDGSGSVVRMRLTARENPFQDGAYSSDGKRLAVAGKDWTLSLWYEDKGLALLWQVDGPEKKVPARPSRRDALWPIHAYRWPLGFSRDGKTLLFKEIDLTVRFLDARTGAETGRLDQEEALAVSACGRFLATLPVVRRELGPLRLWDLHRTGRPRRLTLPDGFDGQVIAFSPDERTLAVARGGEVYLLDTATCLPLGRFPTQTRRVQSLAFSGDGRLLVSSDGGTALVWDVTGRLENGKLRPAPADRSAREASWRDLASNDAAKARRAVWALASVGHAAVVRVSQIQPPPAAGERRIARLLGELGSERYQTREDATAELQKIGEEARPALEALVPNATDLELRRRAERLLSRLDGSLSDGDRLREVRVVHVLEQIGTPEARVLLRRLEGHGGQTRLGLEAKAALQRLARRPTR